MGANKGQYGLPPGVKDTEIFGTRGFNNGVIVPPSSISTGNRNSKRDWTPIYVPRKTRANGLMVNVTTLDAGGQVRIGLYTDDDGYPGKLIQDGGLVSMASTGEKVATIDQMLSRGLHWVVGHQMSGASGWVSNHAGNGVTYFPLAVQTNLIPGAYYPSGLEETGKAVDEPLPPYAPGNMTYNRDTMLIGIRITV